jgi:transcriptional regulator with XRE-family HTH domain
VYVEKKIFGDFYIRIDIDEKEYESLENGKTEFDYWVLTLANITVALGVPCRTLIADEGVRGNQFQFAHKTPTGVIINKLRCAQQKSLKELAEAAEISLEEYKVYRVKKETTTQLKKTILVKTIEGGASEMEKWSKLLLHIAELLETRVYDLLYPSHRIDRPTRGADGRRPTIYDIDDDADDIIDDDNDNNK